ncbi:putative protein N(5)-glutamine methyltransferase [Streptomyces sp. JJ66]|uniref:putative protein N(5)-glutamine methyltransferase n=1 Tax=Streptomyces sp. JJ66 TaxID=2803843 RepID=UPI001C57A38C|nr:putative protein N(5)-glutamine methyltransferase [Streptomyces sp. JJ66]MBW1603362.1 putative protein N(5)-glutamine methyltransferase [Streptomyces sp. JJ66]
MADLFTSADSQSALSSTEVVAALRAAGCVFAEDEADLLLAAAASPTELATLTERRCAGLPLEQVLGWAEFCGTRVVVEPGVFVPRRRTEFLVQQAAALLPRTGGVVLDLCCGSGAVGAALTRAARGVELHAADVDPAAVACARRNLAPLSGHVHHGDLYRPLPPTLRGRVHVLVANAPYVPTDALGLLPPEARDHEPRVALDGGTDGLAVQRRVVAQAARWLAPTGHLLIETSVAQAPDTARTYRRHGLTPRLVTSDDLHVTVVIGTPPGSDGPGAKGGVTPGG